MINSEYFYLVLFEFATVLDTEIPIQFPTLLIIL